MVAWRFVVAAVLAAAFHLAVRGSLPRRSRWPVLLALGILYACNGLAYLSSLQWIPATTASLVFYTYPAVVVLAAGLFLGEPFTSHRLAALVLTLSGCGLTAGVGVLGGDALGVGLVMAAVLGLTLYVTASRSVFREQSARGGAVVVLIGAACAASLAALLAGGLELGGGRTAALYTGLMGLVATALPVTLFLVGLKGVGAGRAALYATVEPALTVVLAGLLLGERISLLQYAGGGLVLAGVLWLRLERPLLGSERPSPVEA